MTVKIDTAVLDNAERKAVALREEASAARAVAEKAQDWAKATEDLAAIWEKTCEMLARAMPDVDKR